MDVDNILGSSQEELDNEMLTLSKMKQLKVRKINPDAEHPKYNYNGESGFD
jgi:hypothetical protein